MIGLKAVELKTGKPSLLSRSSHRFNHIIHDFFVKVRRWVSYINRRSALLLVQYVVAHSIMAVHGSFLYTKKKVNSNPHTKKYVDMITGKGVIKRKGAVSIYLKQIKEEEEKRVDTETLA